MSRSAMRRSAYGFGRCLLAIAVVAALGIGAQPASAAPPLAPGSTHTSSGTHPETSASYGPLAYVVGTDDDLVSVIDTSSNAIIATIPVGSEPESVAITPDGTHVYVGNAGDGTVSVIDTVTNVVTATLTVDAVPEDITSNAAGTEVYVASIGGTGLPISATGSLSVIDTATDAVTTVTYGEEPDGVAVNAAGTVLYLNRYHSQDTLVIDAATYAIIATIPVGNFPRRIALNPSGTRAYVSNVVDGTVSVIDTGTDTVIATVGVGGIPSKVLLTPDGTAVYVANTTDGTVSVINAATDAVTATIPVGYHPIGVAFTPDGARAYITNEGGTVSVINTATGTVTATITGFDLPFAVAIDDFAPSVTAVSPNDGPVAGGTTVTVTGLNLTGATGITFGAGAGTAVSCTATSCTVVSPAGTAGPVDIRVTTPDGTSAAGSGDRFTYNGPISYLASAGVASNATSETLTIPATVPSGAVLLLYATVNTTGAFTTPAGWHLLAATPTSFTAFVSAVWWRTATATDHGTTVTISHGTGIAHGTATLLAYGGVNPTSPIGADNVAYDSGTPGTVTTTPTVAVTTPGSWIVSYWACKSSTVTTLTPATGPTTRITTADSGGGHINSAAADGATSVGSGTYGGYTATSDQSHNGEIGWTVALSPTP